MPCGLGRIDSFCKIGDVSTAPVLFSCSLRRLPSSTCRTATLNAELRSVIVQREKSYLSTQHSNLGGWQSSWDMDRCGGAPALKL